MRFFLGLPPEEDGPAVSDDGLELLSLPDWETLPYDTFSPHQDIISQRLETLFRDIFLNGDGDERRWRSSSCVSWSGGGRVGSQLAERPAAGFDAELGVGVG